MIYSKHDMIQAVKGTGSHFFDDDARRFFNSRIGDTHGCTGGCLFIESVKGPSGIREYQLIAVNDCGQVMRLTERTESRGYHARMLETVSNWLKWDDTPLYQYFGYRWAREFNENMGAK